MAKVRINWPLLTVIMIACVVLAVVTFTLRKWQLNRMGIKARQTGLTAWQQEKWDEAAKNLGSYIAVNSSDVNILLKYADAQLNIRPLRQGNFQQAIAAYRNILRIDKSNAGAAEKLINLYIRLDVAAEAQLVAERYLLATDNPRIRILNAIALAKQKKIRQAAQQLQAVISVNPQLVIAYETLVQLKEKYPEKLSDLENSQHWLDAAVKANPDSASAFIARAAFALKKNDRISAIADLEQAEKMDMSDSETALRLAVEFINAKLFDKARSYLANVRNAEPKNEMLWQIWAQLAIGDNSTQEMVCVAREGLKMLAPSQWDFMPAACELFIRGEKFDDAAYCLAMLKQKDIAPAITASLEAMLAQSQKQDHKAIFFLRRAMQAGDKSEQTRLALAKAYYHAGDYQSAIRQLRTLVAEKPRFLVGRMELARQLCMAGEWTDAENQAHAALEIAPESLDAALISIEAKMNAIDEKQGDKDGELLNSMEQRLAELDERAKGNFNVVMLRFQLAIKRKKFTQAEQMLEKLKREPIDRAEIAMAEIDLLTAQEKTEQAIKKLQAIVETFPQDAAAVKRFAFLLDKSGDKNGCEKLLTDSVERIEDAPAKRELGFLLEYFYWQWQQSDKAYTYLSSLAERLPEDIPVKRKLLTYKQLLKDAAKSQLIVDEIKALEGEDGWQWRCEQAKLWFNGVDFKKRCPQIITILEKNIAANPAEKASIILLANTYQKDGEIQLAITTYCQALSRWPNDIDLVIPAVMLLQKARQYPQADEILDRLAKDKLDNPQVSRLFVQSYIRRGKLDYAESALQNMRAAEPNSFELSLFLALLEIKQGKYDQALELLASLKSQQPDSFLIAAAIVELNARQKKTAETRELCDDMIKRFGNASAYLIRAKALSMLGDNDAAEKDLQQAIMLEPNNVQVWIAKSDFELLRGRNEAALDAISKAVTIMPGNTRVEEHAVGLLLASEKPHMVRKGIELLDKALAEQPYSISLRLYKARSLLIEDNAKANEQAMIILQQITSEQPAVAQAWAMLAQLNLKNSQLGPAMDNILRGLTYAPDNKTLLLLKASTEAKSSPEIALPTLKILGQRLPDDADVAISMTNVYMLMGSYKNAVDSLKKFLPSCGENDRARVNTCLAVAMYKNGQLAEAEKIFDEVERTLPDDTRVYVAQMEMLKDAQNWDLLARKIESWFLHDTDNPDCFVKAAESLAASGNPRALDIAERLLGKILELNQNHVEALNVRASILQIKGQNEQAAELYRRTIELKPDSVVAVNNLAWILCESQGKYGQALELAQKGLSISGDYLDLIDTRGVIYYRLGNYKKAEEDLSKCVELYPADSMHLAGSYFHLGRTQAAMGRSAVAINSLKRAIELGVQAGGLTTVEITEAESTLSKLSEELNHATVTNR